MRPFPDILREVLTRLGDCPRGLVPLPVLLRCAEEALSIDVPADATMVAS